MTLAMATHPPANTAVDARVQATRREARLRAEHAHRYPGIRTGEWEPAATLADRVVAGSLLWGRVWTALQRRPLSDEHFEFRGGDPRAPSGKPSRPRREDR